MRQHEGKVFWFLVLQFVWSIFFISKNVDHDILFLSYLSFFWC